MRSPLRVALISMITAGSAFAQIEKGNFLLGGSLGFSSSKYPVFASGDEKTTSYALSPNASYFIVKGLAVGITPSYSYTKLTQSGSPVANKTRTIAIGPQVRYYFKFNRWGVFPHASYSFGWTKTGGVIFDNQTGSLVNVTPQGTTNLFKAGVGGTYFVNKNIGIEGIFFYQKQNTSYDQYIVSQNISSLNFNIGLQVFLSRKSE